MNLKILVSIGYFRQQQIDWQIAWIPVPAPLAQHGPLNEHWYGFTFFIQKKELIKEEEEKKLID